MKRIAWLIFGLLPCSSNAEDYVRLSSYYYRDKPLFCFEVPVARARNLPAWNGSGAPPISQAQAVEIGRRELGLPSQMTAWRAELNKIKVSHSTLNRDVWYYLIDYRASEQEGKQEDPKVAVVLLDGTVVSRTEGNCTHFRP